MITELNEDVTSFHVRMGQPVGGSPAPLSTDRLRFRLRLITEEFFETLEAAGLAPAHLAPIRGALADVLSWPIEGRFDMPAFVDGLADLDYVVEGARVELGVNGAPIAAAVHAANMRKEPVEGGKARKPEWWTPPNVSGELTAQGWRP